MHWVPSGPYVMGRRAREISSAHLAVPHGHCLLLQIQGLQELLHGLGRREGSEEKTDRGREPPEVEAQAAWTAGWEREDDPTCL